MSVSVSPPVATGGAVQVQIRRKTNAPDAWPWLAKDGLSAHEICEQVCAGEGWWVLLCCLYKGELGMYGELFLHNLTILSSGGFKPCW